MTTIGEQPSNCFIIPPSTKGLNYKDPYYNMDPEYCIDALDVYPGTAQMEARRGSRVFNCIGCGQTFSSIDTIAELSTQVNGYKFIAGSFANDTGDGALFNITGGFLIANGDFSTSTGWSFGSGWTYDGVNFEADHAADGIGLLSFTIPTPTSPLMALLVSFRVKNWTFGTVTPSYGGVAGTARGANGFYYDIITPSAGYVLSFQCSNDARLSIDVVVANFCLRNFVGGGSSPGWQHVTFRNRIFLADGVHNPQDWDGLAAITTPTAWTGIGSPSTLVNVAAYKSRLYFVQKNTLSVWYGAIDGITGTLSQFDAQSLFTKGGHLVYAGGTTRQQGAVDQELFCMISSMGEILVYQGYDPASTTWSLVGHYYIAPILGYRSVFFVGAHMHILTVNGVVAMGTIMAAQETTGKYNTLTDLVDNKYSEDFARVGVQFGWQGVNYPKADSLIINVPATDPADVRQWVANTTTGAWGRYGYQARCWSLFNNNLYFGSVNGYIIQADYPSDVNYDIDPANNDNPYAPSVLNKNAFYQTAYNYCGDYSRNKHFVAVRSWVNNYLQLVLTTKVYVDFGRAYSTNLVTLPAHAGWQVDFPYQPEGVLGKAVSVYFGLGAGNYKIAASEVFYKPGGIL